MVDGPVYSENRGILLTSVNKFENIIMLLVRKQEREIERCRKLMQAGIVYLRSGIITLSYVFNIYSASG